MGYFGACLHAPRMSRTNHHLQPIGGTEPLLARNSGFDATVQIHLRMEIDAGILSHPVGSGGIVRKLFAAERAMFLMHQCDEVNGVDSGHAGHVVQYDVNAFVMHFPRIGASVNFEWAARTGSRVAGRGLSALARHPPRQCQRCRSKARELQEGTPDG